MPRQMLGQYLDVMLQPLSCTSFLNHNSLSYHSALFVYWCCQWLWLQHLMAGCWVTKWKTWNTSVTTVCVPAEIWTKCSTQVKPEPTCMVTAYVLSELLTWWRKKKKKKKTPWSESANEVYRPSDRRLSAKWLPTFADKGCHVVSVTDPYGHILGFIDRSRYFSIK
jgi:hypothetical protein